MMYHLLVQLAWQQTLSFCGVLCQCSCVARVAELGEGGRVLAQGKGMHHRNTHTCDARRADTISTGSLGAAQFLRPPNFQIAL